MPHSVFTRQQLYDLVWTEPTRTVAQQHGVSDVGLAKACRAAGIPLPPRGYWAKLQHGKALPPRPRLPTRPDASDRVVIAPSRPRPERVEVADAIKAVAADQPPIVVPDDLRAAHPIVRAMVADNAERRRQYRREGWSASELPDLSTPLAIRRLRILSALLKTFERHKHEVAHGPDGLSVKANGETLIFALYERSRIELRAASAQELR